MSLFRKQQKLKQIEYFMRMKNQHYEHFLSSFKDDIKGTNLEFEEGEKSEILRKYTQDKFKKFQVLFHQFTLVLL